MLDTMKIFFANILNFKDRTSRGDFWITCLGVVIFTSIIDFFVFGIIGAFISDMLANIVEIIYLLLVSFSLLSLEIRRLHDVNKSGWYLLIGLIPLIGMILLFIAYCSKTVEPNKYGKQV